MQNGEIVLSQLGLYTANGRAQHVTSTLSTDNHVEIMIVLQGMGEAEPYTGPKGEMIELTVVPEFGAVVFVVLLLGITSTIVFAKNKFL
jgi:predicted secreted protein with PEFG-CTERM motif